jgi:hypothetical protein
VRTQRIEGEGVPGGDLRCSRCSRRRCRPRRCRNQGITSRARARERCRSLLGLAPGRPPGPDAADTTEGVGVPERWAPCRASRDVAANVDVARPASRARARERKLAGDARPAGHRAPTQPTRPRGWESRSGGRRAGRRVMSRRMSTSRGPHCARVRARESSQGMRAPTQATTTRATSTRRGGRRHPATASATSSTEIRTPRGLRQASGRPPDSTWVELLDLQALKSPLSTTCRTQGLG